MRELVIIPTFQRSDMLAVCLESIRAAEPRIPIHVFPDRGSDERLVCSRYIAIHHLTVQHQYHGNSYNVMEALKWAYSQPVDLVYIIEDDAIIDSTFFTWCRSALERYPNSFAACGWRYSPDALISDGPDLCIPWYLSVAAAIPRKSLYWIIQHAKPEYYSDMQGYLDLAYPSSHRKGGMHFEQDGLVLRVADSQQRLCVWPRRPRATHLGWHGYHMPQGKELTGTLDERIAVIKLMLRNPALLHSVLVHGVPPNVQYCSTCMTPLLVSDISLRVQCVACFHRAHPQLPRTAPSHYYLKGTVVDQKESHA